MNATMRRRPGWRHVGMWTIVVLACAIGTLRIEAVRAGQKGAASAQELYQQAVHEQDALGNLAAAIKLYQRAAAASSDRALAAKALLAMGRCYEKLGKAAEARKAYDRLSREYADQVDVAAEARTRLAALQSPAAAAAGQVARLIWNDVDESEYPVGAPSADGRYVSFTDGTTGELVVRDLREGTTRRLTNTGWTPGTGGWTTKGEVTFSLVSPDGRQVAYTWFNLSGEFRGWADLRILPLSGEPGEPRIVHRSREYIIQVFDWTPDGRSLIGLRQFQDRTYQLAVISIAEGSLRVLKSLEWRQPRKVSLSPDGRFIAYDAPAATNGSTRDIFLLAADGSRETGVVQNPANDEQPVWSPDGSQILFVSNRTGKKSLWTVHIDAGKPVGVAELVKPDIERIRGMARSGALYYVSGGPTRNIYTVDVDANLKVKNAPVLATDRFLNSNGAPAWSPDGQYLAYRSVRASSDKPDSTVIVIRSLKTGEEREVPSGQLPLENRQGGIRWFPDGRSLLVRSRDLERDRTGYYRLDTTNGNAGLLLYVKNGLGAVLGFDLSPDGKSIFYIDRPQLPLGPNKLMRFDMDSRRETELIRDLWFRSVAVSPDGAQLAFSTDGGSLAVVPAVGGERRIVFQPPNPLGGPARAQLAWTPDQRYLLFAIDSDATGGPGDGGPDNVEELWRVPVAGEEAEKIGISVKGAFWSPALDPGGHRLTYEADENHHYELWALEHFLPKRRAAR